MFCYVEPKLLPNKMYNMLLVWWCVSVVVYRTEGQITRKKLRHIFKGDFENLTKKSQKSQKNPKNLKENLKKTQKSQ